jgi:hypothetical protein
MARPQFPGRRFHMACFGAPLQNGNQVTSQRLGALRCHLRPLLEHQRPLTNGQLDPRPMVDRRGKYLRALSRLLPA